MQRPNTFSSPYGEPWEGDDVPRSSCRCSEYLEFGRHDPMNHPPPPPPPSHRGTSGTHHPSSSTSQARAAGRAAPPATGPTSVEQTLLAGFRDALAGEGRKATFTCGGSLPIVLGSGRTQTGDLTPRTDRKVQEQKILSKPIFVRFGEDSKGRTLALPPLSNGDKESLEYLIRECIPATFGRDGKDVLDETYRRAGALSTSKFMTDFCPYETGIIDLITQLLLPPIVGDLTPGPQRSELAVQHDLTADQEGQIRHAIDYEQGLSMQLDLTTFHVSRLQSLFARLYVPLASQAGLREILRALDPMPTGNAKFDDVFAVAAKRLHAKRQKMEHTQGVRTLGPNEMGQRMMCRGLRAELYKLNVYSGPSGLFKPHVDTPRSETQIGSLVVCLPVSFEGGALAVRHHGQEVVHYWAAREKHEPAIQWAAFYSDCEHEVLEVTAGHRVTLTYNLFLAPGAGLLAGNALSLQPEQLPFCHQLQSALATPDFMPKGGYLGFLLNHSYPHTHPLLHGFVPKMLKGSDMVLYEAMKVGDVTCALEPIDSNLLPRENALQDLNQLHQKRKTRTEHSANEVTSLLAAIEIDHNQEEMYEPCEEDIDMYSSEEENLNEDYGDAAFRRETQLPLKSRMKARKRIVWIGDGRHEELSKAYLAYGNQAELGVKYSKVALLVKVPSWLERSGYGTRNNPVSLE